MDQSILEHILLYVVDIYIHDIIVAFMEQV